MRSSQEVVKVTPIDLSASYSAMKIFDSYVVFIFYCSN